MDDPPDSKLGPTVDNKLDEDDIWDFTRNSLAQPVIMNEWLEPSEDTYRQSSIPHWHEKLWAPDFYREESWKNMEF